MWGGFRPVVLPAGKKAVVPRHHQKEYLLSLKHMGMCGCSDQLAWTLFVAINKLLPSINLEFARTDDQPGTYC